MINVISSGILSSLVEFHVVEIGEHEYLVDQNLFVEHEKIVESGPITFRTNTLLSVRGHHPSTHDTVLRYARNVIQHTCSYGRAECLYVNKDLLWTGSFQNTNFASTLTR